MSVEDLDYNKLFDLNRLSRDKHIDIYQHRFFCFNKGKDCTVALYYTKLLSAVDVINVGIAVRNPKDKCNKKLGRNIALSRALFCPNIVMNIKEEIKYEVEMYNFNVFVHEAYKTYYNNLKIYNKCNTDGKLFLGRNHNYDLVIHSLNKDEINKQNEYINKIYKEMFYV